MDNGLERAILSAVDARLEDLVQTTLELVRIPTEVPPGNAYADAVDLLVPRFAAAGFQARRYDLPNDVFEARCVTHRPELSGTRANLLATWPTADRPGLVWYTHLDVVPATERALWEFDPYTPFVQDGCIFGRGAADSKGAAAALLTAFLVLRSLGIEPAIRPVVALTTDEEIGPYTGFMHMADSGVFAGCRWLHNCDAGATAVGFGYCAAFTWRIRVIGRSSHTGAPHLGLNPIERGLPLLQELLSLKQRVEARQSQRLGANAAGTHVSATLNLTIARAGVKHNTIPAELELEGDRRIIPEEDWDTSVEEIETAIERARQVEPSLKYELSVTPTYQTAWASSADDPFVRRLAELASYVRGEPIVAAGGGAFASDAAYVARVTGMALASHGPARIAESRAHASNERVRISDLVALAKIVALLAATGPEPSEIR